MALPFLVDAFNLIHAVPRLRDLARDRGLPAASLRLLEVCTRWLELHPEPPKLTLVYDGNRPATFPSVPPHPRLRLRFMQEQADADIKQLLDRSGDQVLVTNDGELVHYARSLGKSTQTPSQFMSDLRTDVTAWTEVAERSPNLTATEVDYWLETFGAAPKRKPAAPPPDARPALSPDEVQHWLEYFGDAPD